MSSVLGHRFSAHLTVLCCLCFMVQLGCGGEHDADDTENVLQVDIECAGHGEIHGDHCDCDSGFTLSEDEQSCVLMDVDQGSDVPDEGYQAPDMAPEQDAHHDHDMGGEPDMSQEHDLGEQHDQGGIEDMGEEDTQALMFVPTVMQASVGKGNQGKSVWLMEAATSDTMLSLEVHESFGGPTSPGTFPVTSTETDYATCGTCLIVRTGCVSHGDHVDCDHTFMPRAQGDVHIEALGAQAGERITGELVSLVFQEVSIGQDFKTLPVVDGEEFRLEDWRFDVQLLALPSGEEEPECSGHGHVHGSVCHCDAGYQVDPQDSERCVPE